MATKIGGAGGYLCAVTNPLLPFKLTRFKRRFGDAPFTLLDVGAGNHSAQLVKKHLPQCRYFGLDIERDYNNDEEDFRLMEGFYELDLTKLEFDAIPDDFFDAIMIAHVIEHLENGDEVLQALIPKLKVGGVIYVEYPGARSLTLPSMQETLNFHDDPTHVRVYSVPEVSDVLQEAGATVLDGGTRRDWRVIAMMPLTVPYNLIRRGYFRGSLFWDLMGFAEFVYAERVR